MGIIREPLAVLLGLLAMACAAGAAWQAGLAWPAAAGRPLARVTAGFALVLAAFGFSLGYWELLSGIGDLVYRFDTPTTRFLFDFAAVGLPFAALGLVLGVAATLHAADVPGRAIVPAVLAGYAIGWVLDPYGLLAGPRMDPVRTRYAATLAAQNQGTGYIARSGGGSAWNLFGDRWEFGDRDGGSDPGQGAVVLLLIALAVLAVAGGVITAAFVFGAGRKKAKAQLEQAERLRDAHQTSG